MKRGRAGRPVPLWHRRPLDRFRERARDYSRYRPDYPSAALDELLRGLGPPSRIRAADVGAGTGIASRLLAERGVSVSSVEPNPAMRAAARAHPRVRQLRTTGERTGLPRTSVDLVLCAQAFHWFDPQLALREFSRILKPGGRLAILWNERSALDSFTASYTDLVRASAGRDTTEATSAGVRSRMRQAGFEGVRRLTFPHTQSLTMAGLLGQARSISYAPRRGHAAAALRRGLRALHARFADASGRLRVVYRTILYVGTRPGRRTRR
jgi:SAM-dependent methyltransferase